MKTILEFSNFLHLKKCSALKRGMLDSFKLSRIDDIMCVGTGTISYVIQESVVCVCVCVCVYVCV